MIVAIYFNVGEAGRLVHCSHLPGPFPVDVLACFGGIVILGKGCHDGGYLVFCSNVGGARRLVYCSRPPGPFPAGFPSSLRRQLDTGNM